MFEINTALTFGSIIKSVRLSTNDPDRPEIKLMLKANILSNPDGSQISGVTLRPGKYIGPVFVSPTTRWGATVAPGAKAKTELEITVEKEPVKILRVEGGESHFITRVETVEAGKKYKLMVETVPVDKPGSYGDQVRVITDSAVLPYFPLNFFFTVEAPQ